MTNEKINPDTEESSQLKNGGSIPPDADQNTLYIRNSKTISGRLHDELVMMDIEQGKYFSLNPVATRIWDLLGKALTIKELCNQLQAEYHVDEKQCHQEVSVYLMEMEKFRLVIRMEESES